ncbi:hypothetical protein Acsp05_47460 [Actinokineospora sp. NBRC 105648]|nr:hypothetical protein Acsp05_47460 [Actinokineospora sp. NBRC 105648]
MVSPTGVLDISTYATLRDILLKCAIDQPRAVVVDLGSLEISGESLLSVFATVWLRTCDWPGVPLLLAACPPELHGTALHRYVAFHDTVDTAVANIHRPPPTRRAHLTVPHGVASLPHARAFVGEICAEWDLRGYAVAEIQQVAGELLDNTMQHTNSEARLRLELRRGLFTVAVGDDDPTPPVARDPGADPVPRGMGLLLVAEFAKAWGCLVDPAGERKVVWAVLRTGA